MASNMPLLEEVEDNMDEDQLLDPLYDEKLIIPWPHYYSIWDCPKINQVVPDENGVLRNWWRCNWCMNPPAILVSFSATKALACVLRLPESDVRPCPGRILEPFALGYKDLYSRKVEEVWSRQNKKKIHDMFH